MSPSEEREKSMSTANDTAIYRSTAIGVILCVLGVFLRFAYDSMTLSIVSWGILLVGTILSCKAVFKILNAK